MKGLWWLSWPQPMSDYRPLTDPPDAKVLGWWCTGYTSENHATLCALVAATTIGGAKAAVRRSWPEAPSKSQSWRLEESLSELPDEGRFPRDGWIGRRIKAFVEAA